MRRGQNTSAEPVVLRLPQIEVQTVSTGAEVWFSRISCVAERVIRSR